MLSRWLDKRTSPKEKVKTSQTKLSSVEAESTCVIKPESRSRLVHSVKMPVRLENWQQD